MYVYVYIYMCVCKNQSTVHTQTRAHTHMYIHAESRTSIFDIYSGKPCIYGWNWDVLSSAESSSPSRSSVLERLLDRREAGHGRTCLILNLKKWGDGPPCPLHKESWAGSIPNRQVRKSPISWVTCQFPFFRCEFQRRIQSPSVGRILCSMPTFFFVY